MHTRTHAYIHADLLCAHIKNSVVGTHKDVAEDPKITHAGWKSQTHKALHTHTHTHTQTHTHTHTHAFSVRACACACVHERMCAFVRVLSFFFLMSFESCTYRDALLLAALVYFEHVVLGLERINLA